MTELDNLMNMGIDKIQELRAEIERLDADIASHERFGKEFMAENRRLCTVLRDIKNLSPHATDHFDPFQTAKQMAAMALDTNHG